MGNFLLNGRPVPLGFVMTKSRAFPVTLILLVVLLGASPSFAQDEAPQSTLPQVIVDLLSLFGIEANPESPSSDGPTDEFGVLHPPGG